MTYELAKQLKDAAFPQQGNGSTFGSPNEVVYLPTLSELIEACGDQFYCVEKNLKEAPLWTATGWDDDFGVGQTPEEAVAKLWLALNQK